MDKSETGKKEVTSNVGGSRVGSIIKKWSLLFFTIIIFIVFSLLEKSFFSLENFFVIVRQSAITGLLAFGMTFVVVSGEIDLSSGAVATICGVLNMVLCGSGVNLFVSLFIVIVVAIVIGTINSVAVLRMRMPAFIATLAMQGLLTGVSRSLTGGTTYFPKTIPSILTFLGRGFVWGVPVQAIVFGITGLATVFLIEHFYLGRHMYATGGNPVAAIHVGINVRRVKTTAFIVSAVFACLGGIITASMLGAGNAELAGGYLMPALSAVFLGSVFLRGGLPNAWGTILASVLMAMLSNGFVMLSFSQAVKEIVQGVILLTAVGLVTMTKKN